MKCQQLIACLLAAAGLSADLDNQIAATCPPKKAPAPQQIMMENHTNQGHMRSECDMVPGYNAPGRTDVCGKWDFFGSASFILWQPRPTNIALGNRDALTHEFVNPPQPGLRADLSNITMGFEYKPGFKLAFGTSFPHDNWGGLLEYTWLQSTVRKSASQALPGHIEIPWISGDNFNGTLASSSNKWKFHYNCLDASIVRTGYVGTRFLLTPYTGLRFVSMYQKMDVDFIVRPNTTITFPGSTTTKTDSWFLGPRAGMLADWLLSPHFRMIGETALSLLYGHYDEKFEQYGNLATLTQGLAVKTRFTFDNFVPNLDLGFGFGYGRYVNSNKQHLDFVLRYDFLYYWDASHLIPTIGAVILQGLTATFKVDF